jgi:hypothetical protein
MLLCGGSPQLAGILSVLDNVDEAGPQEGVVGKIDHQRIAALRDVRVVCMNDSD